MKLFRTVLLFFVIASFTPDAFAQSTWTGNAFDNQWATANNWNPNGEPAGNALIFIPATITLPSIATNLGNLNIESNNFLFQNNTIVTLNASTSTFTASLIDVNFGATLNLNIPGGGKVTTTNTGFSDFIGDATGNGTLNLSGAGTFAMLAPTGHGTGVGIGGTGTFNQSGSTAATVGTSLFIGADGNVSVPPSIPAGAVNVAAGGTGTYNLSGTSALSATTILIGVGSGTGAGVGTGGSSSTSGFLNITSTSANALTATTVDLGTDAGGTGNLVANDTGTVNQSAGTATITTLNVGFAPGVGVSGSYNLSGTGILNTNLITVGTFAGANGNFQESSTAAVVTTGSLFVGPGGTGSYTLQGAFLSVANTLSLGGNAGGNGTLNQSGGTLSAGAASTVIIGDAGLGTYNLSGGGSADFQTGFVVGNQGGSTGTVTQSGSSLSAEGAVAIGAAGNGTYTMQTDSSGTTGTATFSSTLTVGNNGTLNLDGGTLKIAAGNLLATGGAVMNLGGSTLQFTSGTTFTDPFTTSHTLTANTTSTIDASVPGTITAVTLNNLTGFGGIAFKGTDGVTTFNMGGTNDYFGPTNITSGTLDTGSASITNSSALNIGLGDTLAILNLNVATGGLAFAGSINGTGSLNLNFTTAGDAVIIVNSSNFTGPIALGGAGGNLQIYSGTFGSISGTATSGLVIGGTPLTGSLTVPTTGTVTVGANSYGGPTTINTGFTLNVASITGTGLVTNSGTLNTSNVGGSLINNTGATLIPTGTLTAGSTSTIDGNPVVTGGTTLNVGGTLTSSGTLNIRVNGTTSDVIQVNGASANISGSNINIVNGVGTNSYVVVKTPAAGDLTAAGLTSNAASTLFSVVVAPDSTNQFLVVTTTQQPFSGFTTTPNQAAVAAALDPFTQKPPAAFVPILIAFNNLPPGAGPIDQALEELSPEVLQYSHIIAFENASFLAQRVNSVCADLRYSPTDLDTNGIGIITPGFDSGLGRSLSSLLAYSPFHSTAPNGVNYYPDTGAPDTSSYPSSAPLSPRASSSPTSDSSGQTISDSPIPLRTSAEPALRSSRFNGFFSGDVVLADLNQNQSATNAPFSKASYVAGNATAGVSFRMTSNLSAGVLIDYSHTDAKTDSVGSKTTVDTYSPGLYATYSNRGFYVNGLFAFGLNNYSNSRDIAFLGSKATSSPSGQQYVTNLDVGYDFHPDSQWILGPTLGLTYTHLDIDSFTESGAGAADLTVNSQSVDSLRSRLGGHLVYQTHTGNMLFQPNISVMWQHEFLNDDSGITSQFGALGSNPFTIQSASLSKDTALIGCGLTATLDNSLSLYLNYLVDIGGDDYLAQSVIGGFKASF